jgi:hypothetical protein
MKIGMMWQDDNWNKKGIEQVILEAISYNAKKYGNAEISIHINPADVLPEYPKLEGLNISVHPTRMVLPHNLTIWREEEIKPVLDTEK